MTQERRTRTPSDLRIVWTNEERDLLIESVIDSLNAKKVPLDEWTITQQMLVIAQVKILPEERIRAVINMSDVQGFQTLLAKRRDLIRAERAAKQALENEAVCSQFYEFVAAKGCTPYVFIQRLEGELESAGRNASTLSTEISRLNGEVERLRSEVASATRNSKLTVVPGKQPTYAKPGQTTAMGEAFAEAKPLNKVERLRVLIVHNNLMVDDFNTLMPFLDWKVLPRNSSESEARQACNGRHVFLVEGQVPQAVAKALRDCQNKASYHLVHGSMSALKRELANFIQSHSPDQDRVQA